MLDMAYMRLALQLAEKGCGRVSPNPMVGAVIVKDDRMIGQGWHETYGGLHAERNALANCVESPEGATLYVTLEPCCHFGKTPPCTDAILQSGIRHVVIGSRDPNPLVAGKGVEILRSHGVKVTEDVMKEDCDRLNQVFFYYIQTGLPYVILKYAMTMDGKISTYTGKSRWITGSIARRHVHESRNRYSAIMVGVGTVLEDDPMLTCRMENGRNPLRVVCDTRLRTPLTTKLVTTTDLAGTIIATSETDEQRHLPYLRAGCELEVVPEQDGHLDLKILMKRLGERKIDSVLLEGGGMINWSALQSGIVCKVQAYIAPKLFGGNGKTPVAGTGIALPEDAFHLKPPHITVLGEDLLLESEVATCLQGL